MLNTIESFNNFAGHHSSVSRVRDLRTGGRQQLCDKAASGFERILFGILEKRILGRHGYVHRPPQCSFNTV